MKCFFLVEIVSLNIFFIICYVLHKLQYIYYVLKIIYILHKMQIFMKSFNIDDLYANLHNLNISFHEFYEYVIFDD